MGTAQEYANLACFLASDARLLYVTGTAINLDGGACPWSEGDAGERSYSVMFSHGTWCG